MNFSVKNVGSWKIQSLYINVRILGTSVSLIYLNTLCYNLKDLKSLLKHSELTFVCCHIWSDYFYKNNFPHSHSLSEAATLFLYILQIILTHLHAYNYVMLIGHMFLYYFNLNFVSFNYKSNSWIYFHCWNFILFVTLVPPSMTTPSTKALFKDNSCSHFEVHPSRFFPMHLHTYVSVDYYLKFFIIHL